MTHPVLLNRSEESVFVADKSWEEGGNLTAISVVPEGAGTCLRMYYLINFPDAGEKNLLCIARSEDGYSWDKPDLGDGTNIVMKGLGHPFDWGVFMPTSVFIDDAETDESRRWKMACWDKPKAEGKIGICLAVSSDGLKWSRLGDEPIITNHNDAMSMIAAKAGVDVPLDGGKHFIYQQTWEYNPELPIARDNLKTMHRRISIWLGRKFESDWVGPITILEPDVEDPADLQFYWLTPFHTASGYGGLLWHHHTGDQSMDVELVMSKDGWLWERSVDRSHILELGDQGRFDCGMVTAFAPPVEWKGKALIFYNGRNTVHDGKFRYSEDEALGPRKGIGVAEFSLDLFE
jgi:hypothetical protein